MRERITVRVVLLDSAGRILLMKGRLPSGRDQEGAWFTVGGGARRGEGLEACARREVSEETGFFDIRLGPAVWLREGLGALSTGEAVIFKETYFLAWGPDAEPVRDGWEAHEHDLIDDIRWWALDDLAACEDQVFPERLVELLPDLIAGRLPTTAIDITVTPVR